MACVCNAVCVCVTWAQHHRVMLMCNADSTATYFTTHFHKSTKHLITWALHHLVMLIAPAAKSGPGLRQVRSVAWLHVPFPCVVKCVVKCVGKC